uniref:Integrator complex subunit 8 n=2 Tax=Parascaris TaxID=6254 RepID=A0A915ACT1_PARUN
MEGLSDRWSAHSGKMWQMDRTASRQLRCAEVMNSLNFLRDKPLDNWIEYFLNPRKLLDLLAADDRDVKAIAQLACQFIEQAKAVDKELDLFKDGMFDEDSVTYSRCKAARLWLCALSCLASMDWGLNIIKESFTPLIIKALFNRLVFFCFPARNIGVNDDVSTVIFDHSEDIASLLDTPERIFTAWFYSVWIMSISVRFQETVAKPTVSNPGNQPDANLALAEQIRACIAEHQQKSEDAAALLEEILKMDSIKELSVPAKDCFMDEIVKDCDRLPEIVNPVETVAALPRPNFQATFSKIKAPDWKLLTRYHLICYNFASNKLSKAKDELRQFLSDWPRRMRGFGTSKTVAGRITVIEAEVIGGYCEALQLPCTRGISSSLQEEETIVLYPPAVPDNAWIEKIRDSNFSMSRRAECDRIGAASWSRNFMAENLAHRVSKGLFITMDERQAICSSSSALIQLVQALVHVASDKRRSEEERVRVKMAAHLLASMDPRIADELAKANESNDGLLMNQKNKYISCEPQEPISDVAAFKELLNGGPIYWKVLLSYDTNEIKSFLGQLGTKFALPYRFQVPNMIGEAVLPAFVNKSGYDYIALLLGKLEHLAKIGDIKQWTSFGNECVKELGVIGRNQDVQMRFACDVVRVQLDKWHRLFPVVPTSAAVFVHVTQELQSTVQSLVQASLTMPSSSIDTVGSMMLQMVAFFINTTEWQFILKISSKLKSPFLDVAKVLAAYMTSDPAMKKKVADGAWWQIMHATFEDPTTKRRNDGSSVRDQTRLLISRGQFLALLRLIKEPLSIAFLISFVGKIFNYALMMQHSRSEENARIFIQHSELWQSIFEGSNAPVNFRYVSECLEVILHNSTLVNPINAFWLRSFADYRYAREQFEDALILYMETCVACSDSLIKPFPDNVVDDVMWYKVQRCLRASGSETLAALVCQLMRDPQEHYVLTAKALLESQSDIPDGSSAFFPFISDMNLLEFMHDAYEKLGLTRRSQLLLQAISMPQMNAANVIQNERHLRNRGLVRVLCSQVFRIHF